MKPCSARRAASRHLEIHHLTPFAARGETSLANLARICPHHHDLITYNGASLTGPSPEWHWKPPRGHAQPDTGWYGPNLDHNSTDHNSTDLRQMARPRTNHEQYTHAAPNPMSDAPRPTSTSAELPALAAPLQLSLADPRASAPKE
ncbi:MAG: HNH endonuclease signature motif containing protein [Acidimicrobiales bacterium]